MTAREPHEIARVAAATGTKKTRRTWDKVLVSAFLAGAYIAFGGLVSIAVGVVLHDLNQAAALADRVALLSAGQVVACGHPNDVLTVEHLSEAYGVPVTVHIDDATGALTTRVLGRHCRDRTRVPALA